MDSYLIEIILVLIFIISGGFLSAAEVAIASFGTNKIEELKEKQDKSAVLFERIHNHPNNFFGTIQVVINLLILSTGLLCWHIFMKLLFPQFLDIGNIFTVSSAGIISFIAALLISSLLTLVFTILIPKALGFKYSESLGKVSVRIVLFISLIFTYPVKIVMNLSNVFLLPFKEKTDFLQTRFSEDEIRIIISEGVKTGAIDETEKEIIDNVFEFNDLRANEVMIPRTEMDTIELVDDYSEIAKEILKTNHSLIPIYQNSQDNIIGVLHSKDFIRAFIETKPIKVKNLIRPAYFVPETKLISEILKEMQNRGERLAIVTDEYGGTEGVITIEDILEEIVGDFGDNTKSEIKDYSKLPDGTFYVLGSMAIDDFNEIFNVQLPESDEYNTIAGFIADKSGKILNTGEIFIYNSLHFELMKKIRQKMVQFKVYDKNGELKEKENT
ncbi:MAG TPA: HlyC/CorC family transporter [Ignavibacteria bacterium]|nr:HlyC/CorC family transporter [Ignavibacteria bacterium]